MVQRQIARRGITDVRILDAMGRIPREAFVPPELRGQAYLDRPLPIGGGQTISQPYVVALMAAALALKSTDRVLEIGAGSGYAAAVVAALAGEVHAIERQPELARLCRENLASAGIKNVEVYAADGSQGLPAKAPFDAILVSAGAPRVPCSLSDQLAIGGRLVVPVGAQRDAQTLLRITRTGPEPLDVREEDLGAVRFVPLIGAQGWPADR